MQDNTTPLDPNKIVAETTTNIIVELFKGAHSTLVSTKKYLSKKIDEHDPFGSAARLYANRFETNHNRVKILGMKEPIPLRNIYTKVNILNEISSRHRITTDELEEFLEREKDKKGFGLIYKSQDALSVANKHEKLLILGRPGSGKTTFLKHLCLSTLDGKTAKKRIPIFISLKDMSDSKQKLIDMIYEQFEVCGLEDRSTFVEHLLNQGSCLIALDGLDEIPESYSNKIARNVQLFMQKYSKNQFIVSCRVSAYNYIFEDLTEAEIAQFEEKQINNFVDNWFGKRSKKSSTCKKKIWDNPSTSDLASNPLLLTMLCISFEDNLDFPLNRAELYKDAIDALLRKWDASRGIKRDQIYQSLSPFKKESLFCKIAWENFKEDRYFIKKSLLEKQIDSFLENISDKSKETCEAKGEDVLKTIEAQHGILIEQAWKVYSFAHLSFQEYFAARYLKEQTKLPDLKSMIKKYMDSDKWKETFVILVNILDDSDFVINIMVKEINRRRMQPSLRKFLTTVKKYSNGIKLTESKASAFFLSIAYASLRQLEEVQQDEYDSKYTSDLKTCIKLAFKISQWYDPSIERFEATTMANINTLGSEVAFKIAAENLFENIKSKIGLCALAAKYSFDLKNYLKACVLLTDCLHSDCYISKRTRRNATIQLAI